MNKTSKVFGLALSISMMSAPLVFAKYTEGPVSGGGTISGKVSFKGAQPAPIEFKLEKWPQAAFCGKFDAEGGVRKRQDVRVNGGGLGDVVVYIEKIESGKPFKTIETKIVSDGCRFLVAEGQGPSRAVTVVVNAKETDKAAIIKVKNMDADPSDPKTVEGVLHNPHGYDVAGTLTTTTFNKPIPKKDQEIDLDVKKTWFKKSGAFLKIECDQHNYMNVWAVPVSNPYYAVVKDDGTFEIGEVPPGKYELKAFHQALGFQTVNVDVAGGASAAANFEFAAK